MDGRYGERNGVTVEQILGVLEDGDAVRGRELLRRWVSPQPLRCPCCGGQADIAERGYNVIIICTSCGLQTPSGDMEDAVRTWNRREHADDDKG